MRIALLAAPVSWSGVEVHTMCLAAVLKERGHDVFIVELGRPFYSQAPMAPPCPIVRPDFAPMAAGELQLEAVGFREWLRIFGSLQADIAISAKGIFKFGSLAMELAARLKFKRFLVIEHLHAPLGKRPKALTFKGLKPGFGLWWYRQKLSGYLRSLAPHKIICVSGALADTLEKDYHYPAKKLAVAYSGIDTTFFVPDLQVRHQIRELWKIPEDAFVFGTLGRLSPMKNQGQLIQAFAKLYRSLSPRHDIRLVLVGDGPLRSSLEEMAQSEGVQERVIFAGFSDSPQKTYPGFDVFCLPSTSEALSISLLEAMSCECPGIAAAVGGVPEILTDSSLGWLVPRKDEGALLSAMRSAAELDSEKLQRMGVRARAHVVGNFNAPDRWNELAQLIEHQQ